MRVEFHHGDIADLGFATSASIDLAMFGGNTQFYKPRGEAIFFFRHTARTSIGFRGQIEYISPIGNSASSAICATWRM